MADAPSLDSSRESSFMETYTPLTEAKCGPGGGQGQVNYSPQKARHDFKRGSRAGNVERARSLAVAEVALAGTSGLGFWSATFTLVSSSLGAGLLAFPEAFHHTGLVSGVCLSVLLALMSAYSLHLVSCFAAITPGVVSYQALIRARLGSKSELALQICMVMYCLGACSTYLKVVCDQLLPLYDLLGADGPFTSLPFSMLVVALIVFCLCLIRNLKTLSYASIFSSVAGLYIAFFISFYALAGSSDVPSLIKNGLPEGIKLWWNPQPLFLFAVPLIVFAFNCHVAIVPIYADLKDQNLTQMDQVISVAVIFVAIIYICAGAFGYLAFGEDTLADILVSYSNEDTLAVVGRVAMMMVAMVAYPVNHFCSRLCTEDIWVAWLGRRGWTAREISAQALIRYFVQTFVFLVLTVVVALVAPDIGVIISVIGAISAVSFMLVFPGMLLARHAKQRREYSLLLEGPEFEEEQIMQKLLGSPRCERLRGLLAIAVGVLLGATGVSISILDDFSTR